MESPLQPSIEQALGFRFGVFFLPGGAVPNPIDIRFQTAPNPIDIRFQTVSGLSAEVKTYPVTEGGQNLYTHQLPERVSYGNLALERGIVVGAPSPLGIEFDAAMSLFKFASSNVIVTLFGEGTTPVASWLFLKAYPVKWATNDLDATQESIVIDTMELAYTQMQRLSL